MQAAHQDAVTKLGAQITAAHEATAGKQAKVQALESSIIGLKNKQAELQDQASSLEATVGTSMLHFARWLLMHTSDFDGPRELLLCAPC